MTREEIIDFCEMKSQLEPENEDIFNYIIKALEQEPSGDLISRQAVLNTLDRMDKALDTDRTVESYKELLTECYKDLPSVTPQPKTGYISIDDVMSVFDDFMCGEDEEAETFLEMLKDKLAESEEI